MMNDICHSVAPITHTPQGGMLIIVIVESIEFDFSDSMGTIPKKNKSLLRKMFWGYGGLMPKSVFSRNQC